MSDMVRLEAPPPSLRPPRGPHVTRENPALLPPTNHSARSLLDLHNHAFGPDPAHRRLKPPRKALPNPSGFSQDRFECSQYWFQHCAGHGHFGTPQGRARLLFSVGTDLGRAGSGGGGGRKEEREEQEGESQEHEEEELQEKEQQQNHSAPPPARSGCSSPNSGSITLPPRNPQDFPFPNHGQMEEEAVRKMAQKPYADKELRMETREDKSPQLNLMEKAF
ncbi:SR-related and CTD-associated factor 4-like [Cinclus cinclus]|uniref:SR-related and CTD-associated factor 4-like n=1 Tax=Cinclus cinclus TaxID=127875 RepID=UPI002E12599E